MFAYSPKLNEINKNIEFKKIDIPLPILGDRDLLVKVEAVALSQLDYKMCHLCLNSLEDKIIGWDISGQVVNVGKSVSLFKKGDLVFYSGQLNRNGGFSEYHCVDERLVGYKPKSLNFKEAAALPMSSLISYEAIFDQMCISQQQNLKQKKVLIVGAAGGNGSMLIQLLKNLTSCLVIATTSRQESDEWVKYLGADYSINHQKNFKDQLNKLQLEEIDFAFFINGTVEHFNKVIEIMKPFGKICAIDDSFENIDISKLKCKSLSLIWEHLFTHSLFQTEDMIKQHHILNKISKLVDEKKLKTILGLDLGTLNESSLSLGFEILCNRKAIGKIALGMENIFKYLY